MVSRSQASMRSCDQYVGIEAENRWRQSMVSCPQEPPLQPKCNGRFELAIGLKVLRAIPCLQFRVRPALLSW